MKIQILILIAFSAILYSCDPINITDMYDLEKNKDRVPSHVIEGLLRSDSSTQYVRISRPTRIDVSKIDFVKSATVTIEDNRGNIDTLPYVDSINYYVAQDLRPQNDGRVYTLRVQVEGKSYNATTILPAATIPVDSLTQRDDKENEGRKVILVYTKLRTEFREYYMFKYYRDGVLFNSPTDIIFANNEDITGDIVGFPLANNIKPKTRFDIEYFSITKEAFTFFNDLNAQFNNDGGVTSLPPANVKGNIVGALGLFYSAYVQKATYVVRP